METHDRRENLSDEELKKKAYSIAFKLKHAGMELAEIIKRLEQEGVPKDIANSVIMNIGRDLVRKEKDKQRDALEAALVRLGIGIAGALVCVIVFPDQHILPIGSIIGGIVSAVMAKLKYDS